ncbi:class A beta-lactamase [Nocardiopsis gilva YIM 90087]|uniref:Beta-lactamase n=1 Tax=Nocardiopsis gilva YIM 90087 TaxID=1235441 RepID=A0A223SAI8_9ACTN|nr:class A beta-lactamase [Nocardiopsis gilva]ASU85137.1 class A beta-lactamase [Nocardiopsis gilva YIM 90087]
MPIQLTRRAALAAVAALSFAPLFGCAAGGTSPGSTSASAAQTAADASFEQEFKQLEKEFDARLGVYAIDTGTDEAVSYRADERFAYASTHKAFSAGAVLQQTPLEELDDIVTYAEDDLVSHSPITEKHVDTGMPLRDVVDAAIRYSDNTAANLLFRELGGPKGLGEALKEMGDETTHVDRVETELNEAAPGDIRDTSTPEAMATTLRKFTLGDTLPADKREILTDMLKGNTTGDNLIRAGVPDDWTIGDRTGGGGYGTRNAIAVAWRPNGDPVVFAIMSSRDDKDAEWNDKLVAEATEIAVDALT